MEYAYTPQCSEYAREQFNSSWFPEPSYNCYSNSYNSGWKYHSNFTWPQQVPDPYCAPYPRPHFSNIFDLWAYYPASQQEPYQHLTPTPSQNYSIDFQEKVLQALDKLEASTQVCTELLHSQAQSFSKIEAYTDQIDIAISRWDEEISSNIEQVVDTEYGEDAWEEEQIEPLVADSSSSEKVFQIRPEEALVCCTMLLSSLYKFSESFFVIEGRSLTWSGATSGTGSIDQKRRNTTSPQNNPRNPKPISNRLREVPNSISYQASNRPIC
ncbi:hypothetical protein RHGRI_027572 [Rhododendron griersonianum]|uniref:Uncharacterized protein n=1 Tax=Rhododendron griersonianum TaxID=479676 RepID=A0AAV6J139_9ERIC|nr:hypothetical protein RHGRI_027572 [Rhododendron griersonianum]